MTQKTSLVAAVLCSCATLVSADAFAQPADAWKWQGTIYAYLPDIGGKTSFPQSGGGGNVGVDLSQLVSNLKFAFMGSLEASNGRWGAFTDLIYLDVGNSKSGTRALTIGGAQLPAGVDASANFDLKGGVWTLAGTYRAVAGQGMTMDLLAGARRLDIRQKLNWELAGSSGNLPSLGRTGASEVNATNLDAIVGLKGRASVSGDGKWFVPYYADVGTGDSELTWQAMAGVGYAFGWGDVVAAWRYTDYKMKSGKPIEALTLNGPAIAAVFRW